MFEYLGLENFVENVSGTYGNFVGIVAGTCRKVSGKFQEYRKISVSM